MKKLFIVIAVAVFASAFASCVKESLSGNIIDRWGMVRAWQLTVDDQGASTITDTPYDPGLEPNYIFTPSRISVTEYPYTDTLMFNSATMAGAASSTGSGIYAYDSHSNVLIMDRTPAKVTKIGSRDMTIEFSVGTTQNKWFFVRNPPIPAIPDAE